MKRHERGFTNIDVFVYSSLSMVLTVGLWGVSRILHDSALDNSGVASAGMTWGHGESPAEPTQIKLKTALGMELVMGPFESDRCDYVFILKDEGGQEVKFQYEVDDQGVCRLHRVEEVE